MTNLLTATYTGIGNAIADRKGGDIRMGADAKHGICSATIGSVSAAMRAQQLLASAAIHSNIIKTEGSAAHRGCVYSLAYPCAQQNNVRTVLDAARIRAHYRSD